MQIERVSVDSLVFDPVNARKHSKRNLDAIKGSLAKFGQQKPLVVDKNNVVIAGNGTLEAAKELGWAEVDIHRTVLTGAEAMAFALADNKTAELAEWDEDILKDHLAALYKDGWDIEDIGFSMDDLDIDSGEDSNNGDGHRSLVEKFGVPPFSVLDTRQGYWKERKAKWLEVIGDNGESREATLSKADDNMLAEINSGVSILDPCLAELVVKWFAPKPGSSIVDPFAGDTVFGYVAKSLGHKFTGIELRQEQADLNQSRCDTVDVGEATYHCDTSENIEKYVGESTQDLLFSCPPYFDLEVYSDSEQDLSNQGSYQQFYRLIGYILNKAALTLKDNRFAVITIGEVRDKKTGAYHGLVNDIVRIMRDAGLEYYNELILVNSIGTARLRANRSMKTRKMVKVHQNVLVFYKGDTRKIKNHFEEIEITLPDEEGSALEEL